jgi:hypothetical protein
MKGFGAVSFDAGDQNWHRADKRGIPAEKSVYSRRGTTHGTRTWFRVGFRRLCAGAARETGVRPGPQIHARYTVTSAQAQNLNRPLGVGTAAAQLIAPGTMYGDRVTQLDVRFGKLFRMSRSRVLASVDIFNVLNSSAILSLNATYGTTWLSPTQILQGRLVMIGAQLDF